jgi:hypothetical protein
MELHPEFLAAVTDTGEVHRQFLKKVGIKSTAVFRLPGAASRWRRQGSRIRQRKARQRVQPLSGLFAHA